jgi:hypothetical protein
MTTTNFSQSVNSAGADSLTWGTALSALGNGSFSLSGAVDNRPTLGTTVSFDLADMLITFSSSFTAAAGGYLTVGVICAIDGSTYPNPPGSSAVSAQLYETQTFQLNAVATTAIELPNLILRPFLTKFVLGNSSGVVFPTATITATLMRRSLASF